MVLTIEGTPFAVQPKKTAQENGYYIPTSVKSPGNFDTKVKSEWSNVAPITSMGHVDNSVESLSSFLLVCP
jgi:hypothetical protein